VERGHQVFQMGKIYSHAQRVCVWLGHQVTVPIEHINRSKVDTQHGTISNQVSPRSRITGITWLVFVKMSPGTDSGSYKRLYWPRKSKCTVGISGSHGVGFSKALCSLHAKMKVRNDPFPDPDAIWDYSFYTTISEGTAVKLCTERMERKDVSKQDRRSLFSLFQRYRPAQCSDFRDKIFGLLSFAPACCRIANPVDYTCSAYLLCNRLLEHHHKCHSDEEDKSRVVTTTGDLQRFMAKGAEEQTNYGFIFVIGGPHEVGVGSTTIEVIGYVHPEEKIHVTEPLVRLHIDGNGVWLSGSACVSSTV
jgi:hypothetical protein